MEDKDYFIIFLIVILISLILLYVFRYKLNIETRQICPNPLKETPPATCPPPSATCPPSETCPPANEGPSETCPPSNDNALDCKFLLQKFDWPTISKEELVNSTWEDKTTKDTFIFNSDGTIDSIVNNNKRPYGFYFNTSYIIWGNNISGHLLKLIYNPNNTLYLTKSELRGSNFEFVNKASASRTYKNLPQMNDSPYSSVWKWMGSLIVITKNNIYQRKLNENEFSKEGVKKLEMEEWSDDKGNKFYIFSITDGNFGNKLLYHQTKRINKLDAIIATLDKV